MRLTASILFLCLYAFGKTWADGPSDNKLETVRSIPPAGIAIGDEDRSHLSSALEILQDKISQLQTAIDRKAESHELIDRYLPDVQIFARAVKIALDENGFFEPNDVDRAKKLLFEGNKRADSFATQNLYWRFLPLSGFPTVRGYRSKLDGSVQPYGVVTNQPNVISGFGLRADIWCRGRSEKGLELQFIDARMTNSDPTPSFGAVMIHPFGRYCNANKLAGEVDTLEVLEHAIDQYGFDRKRIAIRGFSMGGAAAWHLAVHYPDKWFAATPGAGFSETPEFLKVFQSEELRPSSFEQKLWQMYDCPNWALNLRMLPTIAYSGELDKQKQAADVMAKSCWELPEQSRFELAHIVAPKTAHTITPEAKSEIDAKLSMLDNLRSSEPIQTVRFTTRTLKYNRAHWITIDGMAEHWTAATIQATIVDSKNKIPIIAIEADGIKTFSIDLPTSFAMQSDRLTVQFVSPIERSNSVSYVTRRSDRSWHAKFDFNGERWAQVSPVGEPNPSMVKKHNLQGPIDDALMDSFLFVKPSSSGWHPEVDAWVVSEMERGVREWHRQMRGDVRIKASENVTPADIENHHLILWGDPKSNPTIGKVIDKLPLQWNEMRVAIKDGTYVSETHAPVLIYPNPLNPERYIVLNSSFTYREYDYLNNARQVPKLPDWAIIDLSSKPNAKWPGKVVAADFFDEAWKVK
jgi:pimeloyl-ACP methyl ester carboxylesterase